MKKISFLLTLLFSFLLFSLTTNVYAKHCRTYYVKQCVYKCYRCCVCYNYVKVKPVRYQYHEMVFVSPHRYNQRSSNQVEEYAWISTTP